jgi:hypothetical protein
MSLWTDALDFLRKVMMAHSAYWKGLLDKAKAIVFGPVLDPGGGWGLGVLEGTDETEIRCLLSDDPAAKIRIAF